MNSLNLFQSILSNLHKSHLCGYILLNSTKIWTHYTVIPVTSQNTTNCGYLYLTSSPLSSILKTFKGASIIDCSNLIQTEVGATEFNIVKTFSNLESRMTVLNNISKICRPKKYKDNTTHRTYERCRVTFLECLDSWMEDRKGDLILREVEDLDEEVERRVERRWEGVEDEEDFDEEVKELGASEFAHLIKDKKHWLAIKKAKVRKIEEGDSEVMTLKDFSI